MAYIWDIPGWNSGAKVKRSCWGGGKYIFRRDDGTWIYPCISFEAIARSAMKNNDWELYIETPAEVEVFEWMAKERSCGWYTADRLMTEAEAAEYFNSGEEYRKTGRSFKVPATKKE